MRRGSDGLRVSLDAGVTPGADCAPADARISSRAGAWGVAAETTATRPGSDSGAGRPDA
jgi:hypothetical protein